MLTGIVIVPIALLAMGLYFKSMWVTIGSAIAWVALGAYGLAEGAAGTGLWILGSFSILFALITFIYATMRMSEKHEPDVDIPSSPDESYERELRREHLRREKIRQRRNQDRL